MRLIVNRVTELLVSTVFISIPSGAIKRPSTYPLTPSSSIFQFLLVRLRVLPRNSLIFSTRIISIPSGAIKRLIAHIYKGYWAVSVSGSYRILFKFQFLLVRLRALLLIFIKDIAVISIPSGAIKRRPCWSSQTAYHGISIPSGAIKRINEQGEYQRVFTQFQFLLVRLRELLKMYWIFIVMII